MPQDSVADHGIAASSKRRKDVRILTGRGRYTADIPLHFQTFADFARSNMARAEIVSTDTTATAAMPGVLAIFTGDDFAAVGGNPASWLINSRDGTPMKEIRRPVLAHGKVNAVIDALARSDRWAVRPVEHIDMPLSPSRVWAAMIA